ncbi:aminodeoxychorismate lyase [Thioalkalivibrio sulfidiphilus]|uniref:aminodeoxychorismate lyase n=1 Tax=Thioalkalivibrio sulfidiphilus TaxID=1033854 RepID=UPI00036E3746|nr:aminodeoxychorismate lyase [Thioalkalivibrio sulfidiphilus]
MILVNGQAVDTLPVQDRGLAYGDGLFETLAVRDGKPLHWDRHMARMAEGCARLGLPAPDAGLWLAEAHRVLAGGGFGTLKLILTRGVGPRGYRPPLKPEPTRVVMGVETSGFPAAWSEEGVEVWLCRTRLGRNPLLAGIKHLNRLEQVLGRSEWQDECQEGIMLDTEDHVVEGTMSNLFLIRDDQTLITPVLDQCGVAGITRARVLDAARALGVSCHEARLTVADLFKARGLFLTNTLIGLWPVRRLDGREIPRHELVARLRRVLTEGMA